MKFLFKLSVLLVWAVSASAAEAPRELKPNDFAWGIPLEVDGDGAIYALELPEQVYRHVTRADLGDLRVFNSGNAVVPHMLRIKSERQRIQRKPVALKLFPLYVDATNASTGGANGIPNIHITTDAQGTIIDISGGTPSAPGQNQYISAYVVDLGPLLPEEGESGAQHGTPTPVPDWLEFNWQGAPDSFATTIGISVSDDLDTWQTLIPATTLSQFHFQDNTLQRRRVELNGLQARYLRITWPAGKEGVQLEGVIAGFGETLQESGRRWSTASSEGTVMRDDVGNAYVDYDASGFLPVDRLRLKYRGSNGVTRVRVFSRPNADAAWRPVYNGLVYRLNVQGQEITNPVSRVPLTRDRYWRIELPDATTPATNPVDLELGWRPHQLIFVASGEAPFRVAYGSVAVGPASSNVPALLTRLGEADTPGIIKTAQAGSEIELGGSRRTEPPVRVPWRKFILWGVLILGVVLVAFMVMRLAGEMKGDGDAH